jgi:hypothetical protein
MFTLTIKKTQQQQDATIKFCYFLYDYISRLTKRQYLKIGGLLVQRHVVQSRYRLNTGKYYKLRHFIS